ncbi:MAG: putative Alpha-galactosidase [Promethearchaeota archaeon]|nr:MAG: putative Alpha-galactosidase [Candidatus Lokiarchaeota archaeon]
MIWLNGLDKPTDLKKITWFKNGWQSWSPCKLFFGDEKDRKGPPLKIFKRVLDNQDYGIEGRFYSEYFTAITELDTQNSLIMGFTTLTNQFSRIILDYDSDDKINFLTAFGCMDGVTFKDSSIDSSEELFLGVKPKGLGYYGLIEYARAVKERIEGERITEIPVGWASWYYYFTEVTEEDMIKNLNFFENNKDTLPIDFIQLDDGYFNYIGDYKDENEDFSKGLDWVFKKIKNAGYYGGLWTAPFFAVKKAKLLNENKKWFLTKQGKEKLLKTNFNWGSFQYSLDLSKESVLEYLEIFFHESKYAFNKKYEEEEDNILINFFKIDFLHAGVPYDAEYSDKSLTRAQILYNGVKAIRKGIGEESFLLGCGAPLGPCVGLVDAMRISMDTGPKWKSWDRLGEKFAFSGPVLKRALINILYRSFTHKYFWINDPDCLMIRRTDTDLTVDEIRLQITIFGLSGGQILISDDMTKLTEKEINDAKLVLPPYNPEGYDPIVPDAFTSALPSIYYVKTDEFIGKRYLLALINWNDKKISRTIRIEDIILDLPKSEKKFLIFDFWNQKYVGEFYRDSKISFKEISPHYCQYLSIIPVDKETEKEPILLSSTLHITQGCNEITDFEYFEEEKLMSLEIDLIGEREGKIIFKLPEGREITECSQDCKATDPVNNIWEIYVKFKDNVSIELHHS